MRQLVSEIKQRIKRSGAHSVGIATFDCYSRHSIMVNPDVSFHPASTFKVCVMMEVFHQAQLGVFSLDDSILIKNEFCSIVDGSNYSLSVTDDSENDLYEVLWKKLTIHDLVTRMIAQSSNLATNILIELVTPQKVTEFMHELGAKGLMVYRGVEDKKAYACGLNNEATAKSLMQILKKLALHQVISHDASKAMVGILKGQHYNEGIPALLPSSLSIAHKTGWNGFIYHDAAIIYPPDQIPYILVIMTSGLSDNKEAPELVSSLSKLIYDRQSEWR